MELKFLVEMDRVIEATKPSKRKLLELRLEDVAQEIAS
jgi:hypothetical protein